MTLMTHPSPIPWLYEMHPENGRVYHFPCFGPDPNAGHLDPAAAERSPGRRPTPRPVHPRRVSQREHAGESLIKALLDAKPPRLHLTQAQEAKVLGMAHRALWDLPLPVT